MITTLMPTFAMAAVGSTYIYVFNPKKLGNAEDYNTSDLIFENTTTDSNGAAVVNAAQWQYQTDFGESGNLRSVNSGNYYWMEIGGATGKNCWVAIDIKLPEAGTYTVDLQFRRHANSGGLIIYNLPQTTLESDSSQKFEADDVLATLNLGVDEVKANNNAILEDIGTIIASQANEIRTIVFATSGMATDKTLNTVYLESLDVTKTADVGAGEEEQPTMCTVTYDANGGSVIPENETVEGGTSVVLPTPEREGYVFYGWSDEEATYNPGDTYIVTGDVTLTALWTENADVAPNYTLVYDFNMDGSTDTYLSTINYDVSHGLWSWSDQTTKSMLSTDTHGTFGVQTSLVKYSDDQWLALEINIPAAGIYKASFVRGMSNSAGGYGDVYLFKPGTEVSSDLFTEENKLNEEEISYYVRPKSVTAASPLVINDAFEIEEPGKYILVFKPTRNGDGIVEGEPDDSEGCRMYIHSLTLSAGTDAAVMSLALSAPEIELDVNEFENITASVYLSDGKLADADDYELTYEPVDSSVVEVDPAKGMITGIRKGKTRVRVIASRRNPSGAVSTKSAFVNVKVTDPADAIELESATVEVENGFAKVTGAKMSDGSDADLSKAKISYSVKELDKAGIDEKTGEIVAAASDRVTVVATVTLDGVTIIGEASNVQVEPAIPAGKTISDADAVYNFGSVENSWETAGDKNTNANLIDIRNITDEYTVGGWEWGYTNSDLMDNNAVALIYKKKLNSARFRMRKSKGEWLAMRLDIPESGIYWSRLTTYKDADSAYNGAFDVWVVPEKDADGDADVDNADVETLITDNARVGNIDPDGFAVSDYTDTSFSKLDLKQGRNLIVFKTTDGNYINPTIFTLEGSNTLKTLNFNLEKTVYDESDLGVEETVEWSARRRDGSIIDKSEIDKVTYSSDNESVIIFKNGVLTPQAGGTATVTVSVRVGNVTLEAKRFVIVDAPRTGRLVISPEDSQPFSGEAVKLSTIVKFDSGGTESLSNAKVDYEISGSYGEVLRGGYITVTRNTEKNITVSVCARAFIDGDEWVSEPMDIVFSQATQKDEATYYTQTRRESARDNIKKYEWAKDELETAKRYSEEYISGFEALYDTIVGEGIPRSNRVGDHRDEHYMYCRYCGENVGAKYGSTKAYKVDVYNRPWKVMCYECKRVFPSNDFESFLKLGLNADGTFDRLKALEKHRSLLLDKGIALSDTDPGEEGSDTWYTYYGYGVKGGYLYNDLYSELRSGEKANIDPRTGDKVDGCRWGVDDGMGYLPGRIASNAQERHTYVAYYLHSALIKVDEAIEWLAKVYVYTDDKTYGNAAAILLNRIADVYPSFSFKQYFNENYQFSVSHGGSGFGKVFGRINDCEYASNWIWSADAVYPLIFDEDNNGDMLNYLSYKAKEYAEENGFDYNAANKLTGADIWRNIENNIVREAYRGARQGVLDGNYGQEQKAVASAALVLDSEPESKQMMKWVYRHGLKTVEGDVASVSGGSLDTQLINVVDRDGMGNESAPGYNYSWLNRVNQLAGVLELYDSNEDKYNLYTNPKFAKMFTAPRLLTLAESHTAQIGDSGYTADTTIQDDLSLILNGFKYIKENEDAAEIANEIAEYIYKRNGDSVEGLHYDILNENPEDAESDILKYIEDGLATEQSGMMPAYGFAKLADGDVFGDRNTTSYTNNLRDFWLYFGRAAGHGHLDSLNLGIEAFGLNMAPDNGTPASKTVNMVRFQWGESTIAHNTVTVNNKMQKSYGSTALAERAYYLGYPKHFDSSNDIVKVMDVESDAYKDTADIYRRTVVMVKAGADVSYGIDFFRVKAGGEHVYSFHSQSHEVETTGLTLTEQVGGSYAGADVPYMYDQDGETSVTKLTYPGTSWLKDVRRANSGAIAEDKFTVDFKITDYNRVLKDSSGLHLRMTMLNDGYDEVAIAKGTKIDAPATKRVQPFEYVLVKNTDGDSLFTTVFQPYKNNPYLEKIEKVIITPTAEDAGKLRSDDVARAVKVTRTDKREDYIIYATNNDVLYTVTDDDISFHFRGFIGVYSMNEEGKTIYRYVNDGDVIGNVEKDTEGNKNATFGSSSYTGTVSSYSEGEPTFNRNFIKIKTEDTVDVNKIKGQYVYIDNNGEFDNQQNAVYKIQNATYDADSKELTIDTGSVATVKSFVDPYDVDAGYVYNIEAEQQAVIPLSYIEDYGPKFSKINNLTVSAGYSVRVNLEQYRTDNNGENVTYAAVSGSDIPRGASVNSATGKVTWKPDDSQIGNHSFKVTTRDESGRETAVNFVVTVYGKTTGSDTTEEGGITGGGGAAPDNGNSTDNTVVDGGSDVPQDEDTTKSDEKDDADGSADTDVGFGVYDEPRFSDLGNHAWAADAINALASEGIIRGTSESTFSPAANITRADFALILVRAFSLTSDNTENFADVRSTDYFAPELAIARNTGIVGGIGENRYAPRNSITRQDMMVIVYRALQKLGVGFGACDEPQYEDYATIAEYAKPAVSALIGAGLVNGKNGRIAPTDYTTRAEVAVLIKRILDHVK